MVALLDKACQIVIGLRNVDKVFLPKLKKNQNMNIGFC